MAYFLECLLVFLTRLILLFGFKGVKYFVRIPLLTQADYFQYTLKYFNYLNYRYLSFIYSVYYFICKILFCLKYKIYLNIRVAYL